MVLRVVRGLATLLGLASPAMAEDCRLALVLALDISGSVDPSEDQLQLQREGLALALQTPEVVRAFLVGAPVALYVFEWSGPFSQVTMPPGWQLIEGEEDLVRTAAAITDRCWSGATSTNRGTAVGAALRYAAAALEEAPGCHGRTVDISGEGVSNIGPNPRFIYESHILDGVMVNALVVAGEQETELVSWFQAEVLHGSRAFCVQAHGYEDYKRAMTAKLLRELEMPLVSGLPVAGQGA